MEDYETKAIRVWMREVMSNRGWTANKWATMAGTSPTNITRFLNGAKFVPSSKTLGKLSYIAGSAPNLSMSGSINAAALRVIPLYNEMLEMSGSLTTFGLSGELSAYRYNSTNISHQITSGDIIVVEEKQRYKRGDLLLFFKDGGLNLGSMIDQSNVLNSSDSRDFIQIKNLQILGTALQLIRDY
jgi:hypothetical protein